MAYKVELLVQETVEVTEKETIVRIKVKEKETWFSKWKIHVFDVVKIHGWSQCYFLKNGDKIFGRWLYMDKTISAILNTKSQRYHHETSKGLLNKK